MLDAREEHRLLCVDMLEKIRELEKPFIGMRIAFRKPRVKNRTYKISGLEFNKFTLLPANSRKKTSTGFILLIFLSKKLEKIH